MKKTLSIFLAMLMVLSLVPTVFAVSNAPRVKSSTVVFEKYEPQDGQTALEEGTYIVTGRASGVPAMNGTFLYGKFVNLHYTNVTVEDDRIIYESEDELNYDVMWDVKPCDDNSFYLIHCADDKYLTPGAATMSLDNEPGNAWTLGDGVLAAVDSNMILYHGYGHFDFGTKVSNTKLNFYKLAEDVDVPIETEDPSVEHDVFVESDNYFASGTYLFVGEGNGSHAMNTKIMTSDDSSRPGLGATTVTVKKDGTIIDPPDDLRWYVDYEEGDGGIITNVATGEILYLNADSSDPLTVTKNDVCTWEWGADDRSDMSASYKNVLKLVDPGESPTTNKTVVSYRAYNGTFAADVAASGSDNIRLYRLEDGAEKPVETEPPALQLPSSVPAGEKFVAVPINEQTKLEAGYYVFATDNNKAMTYTPNNRGFLKGFAAVDIEPKMKDGQMILEDPDATLVWEVIPTLGMYYFRCLVNGQYLAGSGNSYTTGLHLEKDTSAEFTMWQLSQKYESVEWSFMAIGIRNNYSSIAYNADYNQFELNDRGVLNKIVLYKLEGNLLYDGEEPVYPDPDDPTTPPATDDPTDAPTTPPVPTDYPCTEPPVDPTTPPVSGDPTTPPVTDVPDGETYTVKFYDWKGELIAEVEVKEGEEIELPEAPTRENWVFVGWDNDCLEVTEDMTVNAQYAKIGDVNRDGNVNAGDATLILRQVAGIGESLNEIQMLIADANQNEKADAGDATKVLRHAVGAAIIDYGEEK